MTFWNIQGGTMSYGTKRLYIAALLQLAVLMVLCIADSSPWLLLADLSFGCTYFMALWSEKRDGWVQSENIRRAQDNFMKAYKGGYEACLRDNHE